MTTITDLVEVEAAGPDLYGAVAGSPLSRPTLSGGALVAQALRAAAASTGPEKYPHSLHATFIRGGRAGSGVEFAVARTRDGRSFSMTAADVISRLSPRNCSFGLKFRTRPKETHRARRSEVPRIRRRQPHV